jgi:hypothetical protein
MLFKTIYNLGDKIEDRVRGRLSHYPIVYAFIGGMGIVLFWRGIWHTADRVMESFFPVVDAMTSTSASGFPWWDGPLSIAIGTLLLLTAGLFVTTMIGNEIIISGLKKEKKLVEKTEDELRNELKESEQMRYEVHDIDCRVRRIENDLKK